MISKQIKYLISLQPKVSKHQSKIHGPKPKSPPNSTNMTTPQKYDWLVRTPANEADRATRVAVRPAHLVHNKPLLDNGTLLFGGPSLSRQPLEGETDLAVNGSIQLIRAESEEAVREIVRSDPYSKAGFWKAKEAVVVPFRCVLRTPMV